MFTLPCKSPLGMAVLISGRGATLRNLIRTIEAGRLDAQVSLLLANTYGAPGLQYAEKGGIPIAVVDRNQYSDRAEFSEAVFDRCRRAGVDLVVLAGFLRQLDVPDDFVNRVVSIHPALMPSFCGKGFYGHHVHEAVLQAGVKLSGCTVHFVDNQYDHGPIILQRAVPVLDTDTPATLSARVYQAECDLYLRGPESHRLRPRFRRGATGAGFNRHGLRLVRSGVGCVKRTRHRVGNVPNRCAR